MDAAARAPAPVRGRGAAPGRSRSRWSPPAGSRCGSRSRPIPQYDSLYALLWAQEIWDGALPGFDAYRAPTEHPLLLPVGLVARPVRRRRRAAVRRALPRRRWSRSSRRCTGSGALAAGVPGGAASPPALLADAASTSGCWPRRAILDVPYCALVRVGDGARGRAPAARRRGAGGCSGWPGCCGPRRGCSPGCTRLWLGPRRLRLARAGAAARGRGPGAVGGARPRRDRRPAVLDAAHRRARRRAAALRGPATPRFSSTSSARGCGGRARSGRGAALQRQEPPEPRAGRGRRARDPPRALRSPTRRSRARRRRVPGGRQLLTGDRRRLPVRRSSTRGRSSTGCSTCSRPRASRAWSEARALARHPPGLDRLALHGVVDRHAGPRACWLYLGLTLIGLDYAIWSSRSAVGPVRRRCRTSARSPAEAAPGALRPRLAGADDGACSRSALPYVLVQQVEGNVVIPLVMSRQVHLHPAVVLVGRGAGRAGCSAFSWA